MWTHNHSSHEYPSEFKNVSTFNIKEKKLTPQVEETDPVTADAFTLF